MDTPAATEDATEQTAKLLAEAVYPSTVVDDYHFIRMGFNSEMTKLLLEDDEESRKYLQSVHTARTQRGLSMQQLADALPDVSQLRYVRSVLCVLKNVSKPLLTPNTEMSQ